MRLKALMVLTPPSAPSSLRAPTAAPVGAVAVRIASRVGVGVPERAVISGRNPRRGAGPGNAQRLPDLLRDDRGRVLAGDYRQKHAGQFLVSRLIVLGQ